MAIFNKLQLIIYLEHLVPNNKRRSERFEFLLLNQRMSVIVIPLTTRRLRSINLEANEVSAFSIGTKDLTKLQLITLEDRYTSMIYRSNRNSETIIEFRCKSYSATDRNSLGDKIVPYLERRL
ncbi:hypothetical protein TNIN_209001 [Trichonephila inaurata madagascariensis]|uniref:Uncharacterized protein n=1 Tax=Trichonephila inaurata madagascariensis TaxID=2747483 RepID=A0A8X6XIF5_9ARAC|nr:hypothetical protein TNIN_209001 [Trichonephila inaurata madagascariensis]